MKTIKNTLSLLIVMVVVLLSLSSCSEDAQIGLELEGTWQGNMRIYTNYNGRRYQSTYTTIQFTTKGMHLTKGNGYWVDYYSNAPWDYVASRITWHVDNQTIYIHFIEDDTDVEIYDYTLTSDYFSGNIFYNNQLITFNFTPDDDFDSSDYDYSGYYGYGYYNNASGEKPKLIRSFGDIE